MTNFFFGRRGSRSRRSQEGSVADREGERKEGSVAVVAESDALMRYWGLLPGGAAGRRRRGAGGRGGGGGEDEAGQDFSQGKQGGGAYMSDVVPLSQRSPVCVCVCVCVCTRCAAEMYLPL